MKKLLLINGPNLNLLGTREPGIYGHMTLMDIEKALKNIAFTDGFELMTFQSNHEGALIDYLHLHGFSNDGFIINAGAYTHTSIALADAVSAIPAVAVEVHISNIYARESFRHHSHLSRVCKGTIAGLGLDGYRLAVEWFLKIADC